MAVKPEDASNALIPPALLAEVEAMAAEEHRPVGDILREALEGYLHRDASRAASAKQAPDATRQAAREAGARILERRKGNVLPEGVTIRDLQTYGRS